MLKERLVGVDEIGFGQQLVPADMLHESLFDLQVADLVAPLVVVEQAVEAYRRAREDELPHLDIGLDGPRRAEPDQRELPFVGLLLPGGEIDVGQRIELRDRDVDVADADARREHRHAFAFVGAGHRFEFTVCDFALFRIEMFRHEGHAARIPDEDHRIGQLLRKQVQMENGTVVVDNQFGSWNRSHNSRF